jgi:hypothetical protein
LLTVDPGLATAPPEQLQMVEMASGQPDQAPAPPDQPAPAPPDSGLAPPTSNPAPPQPPAST